MSGLKMFLLLLTLTMMTTVLARPQASSRVSRARKSPEPEDCVHGWVMTARGGRVCKKGPRGVCGGSQGQYGVCGENLVCSQCNRCTGCSFTVFRCYSDHDKCASSDDGIL